MESNKVGVQVRNPNLYPNPDKIRNADLYKYNSLNEIKLQSTYRNFVKSSKYIGKFFNGRWSGSWMSSYVRFG